MLLRNIKNILLLSLLVSFLSLPLYSETYSITETELTRIETTLNEQQMLLHEQSLQIVTLTEDLKNATESLKKQQAYCKKLEIRTKIWKVSFMIAVPCAAVASGYAVYYLLK